MIKELAQPYLFFQSLGQYRRLDAQKEGRTRAMAANCPADVIALVARHLSLPNLIRLSAVNTTCRKGCYDPCAIRGAIERGRGGKLTRTELQRFLKINRAASAALAHQYYPKTTFRPHGYFLYDAAVVASAMRAFGENERVVSWKPQPPPKPASRKRSAPPMTRPLTAFFGRPRLHDVPYADWSSLPKASSCGSSAATPTPLSMPSPSGCPTPVM